MQSYDLDDRLCYHEGEADARSVASAVMIRFLGSGSCSTHVAACRVTSTSGEAGELPDLSGKPVVAGTCVRAQSDDATLLSPTWPRR